MKHINMEIGKRIRTAQRLLGYSDRQVAEMLMVSISAYRKMVKGKRAITEESLITIARAWSLNMNFVFHGKGHEIFLPESDNAEFNIPEENYVYIAAPADSVVVGPVPEWMKNDR